MRPSGDRPRGRESAHGKPNESAGGQPRRGRDAAPRPPHWALYTRAEEAFPRRATLLPEDPAGATVRRSTAPPPNRAHPHVPRAPAHRPCRTVSLRALPGSGSRDVTDARPIPPPMGSRSRRGQGPPGSSRPSQLHSRRPPT